MLIRLGYEIAIDCQQKTPIISLLEIHKDRQPDIQRQTRVLTSPSVPSTTYEDRYGNTCRRFTAPPGSFRILYDAVIEDPGVPDEVNTLAGEVPVDYMPPDVLGYLLGSRYCETDHLSSLAWNLFGNVTPGWARVQAVTDYVHNRLSFGYGYARTTRTAAQAHDEQVGVCRDFAHLGIAFCRALNIPARFVSCYAHGLEPGDFHAVFEAYLDGRWWLFDGTRQANLDGLIRIGAGRDAAEIAFASPFGQIEAGPINISIERADGSPEPTMRTTDAISTEEPGPGAG